MADLNVKVGLDRSGFQTGLAAMENDAAKFGQTISNIKPGNISGAFKNIANDLAAARSPGEALSAVMGNLTNLLRGTAFGAAGLAIGKVLSAPFEQLSGLVQSSAASAQQALDSIASAGPAMSFDEAIAQANALDSAIAQIQNSIQQIDTNPFLTLADSFVGAKSELEELEKSLQRVKASQLSEGAFNEANLAESLVGKDADEKARIRIKADAEKERQKIRAEFEGTGLNADSAIADVDRKEAAQLADLDLKKKEKDAKALEELISGFKETERAKQRRADDEEHAAAMKRAQELIDKIEEQNKKKQEDAEAASQIEELNARNLGADAEAELLRRRAAEAEAKAAQSGELVDQAAALKARSQADSADKQARAERLRTENERRGNAADFDPREALIRRMQTGAESGLTPAAMQDPVKNTTVQSISIQLSTAIARLEDIARKAGSFS